MMVTRGHERTPHAAAERVGPDHDVESGWLAIPRILDEGEVHQILADCDALLALPPPKRAARDKAHGGTLHLDQLDQRIPLVADLVQRRALIEAVQRVHPGPGSLRLDSAAFRSPQPGHGGQALHIDSTPDDARSYVTVIVALCAFTTSNGATRVVPRSQHRRDLWRSVTTHRSHPDEVLLVGRPGTAFVLAGGLLHSGTPNRSLSPRPALQLIWRATQAD